MGLICANSGHSTLPMMSRSDLALIFNGFHALDAIRKYACLSRLSPSVKCRARSPQQKVVHDALDRSGFALCIAWAPGTLVVNCRYVRPARHMLPPKRHE